MKLQEMSEVNPLTQKIATYDDTIISFHQSSLAWLRFQRARTTRNEKQEKCYFSEFRIVVAPIRMILATSSKSTTDSLPVLEYFVTKRLKHE
jgi:hypothetical protein